MKRKINFTPSKKGLKKREAILLLVAILAGISAFTHRILLSDRIETYNSLNEKIVERYGRDGDSCSNLKIG